jgi:hypothetical protein
MNDALNAAPLRNSLRSALVAAEASLIASRRAFAAAVDAGAAGAELAPLVVARRACEARAARVRRVYERCVAVRQANARKRFARSSEVAS